MIPYGRQAIDDDDIAEVVRVLRSDWLTTGPSVGAFEEALARYTGGAHAVAVSSGTAALHAAMHAAGVGPGDDVIVSPMTFVATANAAVFQGARPVFADVDPATLLIDPVAVEAKIGPRTKAVVAVDYAGQPCDFDTLRKLTDRHDVALIADACHSLGGRYKGRTVGTLADLSVFSFHPVKHMTTGEGGAIVTADDALAASMRSFRNHGIAADHHARAHEGTWYYEMQTLGYNYRLTDFQCALGRSQLRKLPGWIERRRDLAKRYDEAFASLAHLEPLTVSPDSEHAYHLYVVRVREDSPVGRDEAFAALRERGIGVNVHFIPVNLHPFYRDTFGTRPGDCPHAESAYRHIMSLPMFGTMTDEQCDVVISGVRDVFGGRGR